MSLDLEKLRDAWENANDYGNHRQPVDEPDNVPGYDMKMLEDPVKNFRLKR
jgi:hypothetical protein